MGVTLYHFPPSAPSRGALLAAKTLGIDVDVQIVDLFAKEQLKPDFLTINPQHTIPTLVDGDFTVWDSHAIGPYLARTYGKDDSLYPSDPKKKAVVDQRLYFDVGTLYPKIRAICFPVLFLGEDMILDENKTALDEALGFLDVFLEGNDFVTGPNLTLADCSLVASVSSIVAVGWNINPYGNVAAWLARCALAIPDYAESNQKGAEQFGKAVRSKLQPGITIKIKVDLKTDSFGALLEGVTKVTRNVCKQQQSENNAETSEAIMENYKLLGKIGKGAHGLVFKALDFSNNRVVALKQITVMNIENGLPKNTMREICVLRALQSDHIVKLFNVLSMESAIVIVMEYLQRSLSDVLHNIDRPMSVPQIKTYAKMILLGIDAMHSQRIMHRDLKPANLLINEEGVLKIADFGLSRIYNKDKDRTYTHQVGTRWYRAPELLYGAQKYTPAIDMWAFGCILAEMLDKQPLFPGETDIGQLAIVLATLGTPNEENWPELTSLPDYNKIAFSSTAGQSWKVKFPEADECTVNLIANILKYDHTKRLEARRALNHRFFFERPLPCELSGMHKPEAIKPESSWHLADFDEIMVNK